MSLLLKLALTFKPYFCGRRLLSQNYFFICIITVAFFFKNIKATSEFTKRAKINELL